MIGSRLNKVKVITGFYRQVHPVVIRLVLVRPVMPKNARGKVGFVLFEPDLLVPSCPGKLIEQADDTTHAAIVVFPGEIIYRICNPGRVAYDAEVCFDTAAGPGPAHGNIPEFDHIVLIDEWAVM